MIFTIRKQEYSTHERISNLSLSLKSMESALENYCLPHHHTIVASNKLKLVQKFWRLKKNKHRMTFLIGFIQNILKSLLHLLKPETGISYYCHLAVDFEKPGDRIKIMMKKTNTADNSFFLSINLNYSPVQHSIFPAKP